MRKAILQTLVYGDIFDYPLTKEEIWHWLIWEKRKERVGRKEFLSCLELLLNSQKISFTRGFYHLPEREKIVKIRKQRRHWSRQKIKIAEKVAVILRKIPWIRLVGISGALAMENSDQEDDIDLLIITQKNRLWLTRFLTVFWGEIFFKRRRPGDKNFKDKICLNMFLDEEHLVVPKKERDLFSAHEVCQMRPLWDGEGIYERFLQENEWVKRYLPNAPKTKNQKLKTKNIPQTSKLFSFLILIFNFSFYILNFEFLENFFKRFQLWYMRNRRTTEKISKGMVRFHPQDARVWVLREYEKRLKKLRLT